MTVATTGDPDAKCTSTETAAAEDCDEEELCRIMERDTILEKVPTASAVDERWAPSPTTVTDFPMEGPCTFRLNADITLQPRTTRRFPTIVDATTNLVTNVTKHQQEPLSHLDDQELIQEVLASSIVADVGTYGHTRILKTGMDLKGKMADSGANCCMTNNKRLLEEMECLDTPMSIGVALTEKGSEFSYAQCTHAGKLPIVCDDGQVIKVFCFYNPFASDTIISPQAIVDQSESFDKWMQI
jgi:hypothetical protein